MRRVLALAVVGTLVCAAGSEARTTCRSGEAVYKQRGVRLFVVFVTDRYGESFNRLYACSRKLRRPVRVEDGGGVTDGDFAAHGRRGNRVAFSLNVASEAGGGTTVGWVDVNSGRVRSGDLAGDNESGVQALAIGRRGEMAVAAFTPEEVSRVGYLAIRGKRGFRKERLLAWTGRPFTKGSLALAAGSVTWSAGGVKRSVPVGGEAASCTTGTTRAMFGPTRVFDVVRQRPRGSLLLACPPGAQTRVELARTSQPFELPDFLARTRAGDRVPFIAGTSTIGTLDVMAGTLVHTRLAGLLIFDTALAADGRQAFAAVRKRGAFDGQRVIGRLHGTAWTALATIGTRHSSPTFPVALAMDGDAVTWKTEDVLRRVPLTGEQPITCASGTELLAKGGARVFEVLATAPPSAELYGCLPGAAAPVRLLGGDVATTWAVFDFGEQNGRRLIHASPGTETNRGHIVWWTPSGEVRSGALTSKEYVRDAVLSADGRVAVARDASITYFALGAPGTFAPERRLAKISSRDGYKKRSLRLTDTTVTWRTERGAARSAPL